MALNRHLYPGGNTSHGFFSYYDQIVPMEKARRILVLKGGPGVGKNTLMRRIAEHIEAQEVALEYLHCSSDPQSLDGIFVPSLGFLMVDGTAPHIIDPKIPGAIDGILNLGDCLDHAALVPKAQELLGLTAAISGQFARCYRYLRAASEVYDDCATLWQSLQIKGEQRALSSALLAKWLPQPVAVRPGQERKMFACAITPEGLMNTLHTLGAQHTVALAAPWTAPITPVLESLRAAAMERGFAVEGYYSALHPLRLEHLFIPALSLLFYTPNNHFPCELIADETVLFNAAYLLPTTGEQGLMVRNEGLFDTLISYAVDSVKNAKLLHDDLEAYYTAHMDYTCWQQYFDQALAYFNEL